MFNTYLNIAHFISLFLHASLYKHNSSFAFLTGRARLCDIVSASTLTAKSAVYDFLVI